MHYYNRYDDFYNSAYGHGIPYWADGPDGCRGIIEHTISHIVEACPTPSGLSLIETGCGEGLCATTIACLDIAYTGVDSSSHAIDKARARVRGRSGKIRFGVADVLVLDSDLLRDHYDIVLDVAYIQELETAGFKIVTIHKHPQGSKLDFALKMR